jgi:hypothetical protein
MIDASDTPLLLFTCADLGGRTMYRAVRVDLSVRPGQGRLWLDVSGSGGFDLPWQRHLQRLAAVGQSAYDLPWQSTDLFVSSKARGLVLDGASASLPVFIAWTALLAGVALPDPFLATGVALDTSGVLAPAPRDYIQGKLAFADAYARQMHGQERRHPVWIPAGSEVSPDLFGALDVRAVASLTEGASRVLGLPTRDGAERARS